MNQVPRERLSFLQRVIEKETRHLDYSAGQVAAVTFTAEKAAALVDDEVLAEKVEAFTSRFARLQDTVGDKLLPNWLRALGEQVGAAIDNLDKAEKLGMLASADQWLEIRQLRNQMVHEYIESPEVLGNALETAKAYHPAMTAFAQAMLEDLRTRGILMPAEDSETE